MRRILPAGIVIAVSAIALIAVSVEPQSAGAAVPTAPPPAATQQEISEQTRADLSAMIAELRESLEALRQEVAELRERLREERPFRVIEPRMLTFDQEHVAELTQRARELAEHAAENAARVRLEPLRLRWSSWSYDDRYAERILDHAEELELADAQQQQIRDLQRAYEREMVSIRADIEVAELDLEALEDDPDAELTEVRAALEQRSRLEIDRQMAGLQLRRDVRQLLTPEQRDEVDDMGIGDGIRFSFTGPAIRLYRR